MNNLVTRPKRFWSKVKVGKVDDCWLWQACTNNHYGQIWWERVQQPAHRVAYKIVYGMIPKGMQVCHTCDNKLCVNPKHLFLGTAQDNADDMVRKGRQPNDRGEACHSAKLTENEVLDIRALLKQGVTQRHICALYNMGQAQISNIYLRKAWSHI